MDAAVGEAVGHVAVVSGVLDGRWGQRGAGALRLVPEVGILTPVARGGGGSFAARLEQAGDPFLQNTCQNETRNQTMPILYSRA